MKNIDSDLIRGNIDTIILKTMLEEDKYGLDIIKEVEQRSNGTYELKQPTLYSCLKRLENQELIASYWQNSDIGGKRHYYKLTDKGREFYNKKQEEWAKSKFVIDNLLSNYDYEEYKLVKKDDYEKTMNAIENRQIASPIDDETDESVEFLSDNADDEKIEEFQLDNEVNEEDSLNEDNTYDFNEVSLNDNEDEQYFDEKNDNFEEYETGSDEETSQEENEVVYVSSENYESEIDEEDDYPASENQYELPDQTENENNILSMLRKQNHEEINTYEGDKKSYAHQIKSIYDDVKYVQDDMMFADSQDEEDEVDQKIKEFAAVASELNEFENEQNLEDESLEEETIEDFIEDNDETFENQENDDELDKDLEEYESYVQAEEYELNESEEDKFNIENDDTEEFFKDINFSEDETVEENLHEDENFDDFNFDEPEEELSYSKQSPILHYEDESTSFFDSEDEFESDFEDNLLETTETNDEYDYQNENSANFYDYKEDDTYNFEENEFNNEFEETNYETNVNQTFNQDEYDRTFVNVTKYDNSNESNISNSVSENDDIDSIISKNATMFNSSKPADIFETRYVNGNYKEKLSNLSAYSKVSTETNMVEKKSVESVEVEDIETLKINFDREGIKIKEYKRTTASDEPEKNYLLANKINLIKSIILLFSFTFVLAAMYIVLDNTIFSTICEDFSYKYFLIGTIPFVAVFIYHLIIYFISPYKKIPARYASRIMIFLAVILTVQLLLITYCVNLQIGFYSFTQSGYNHLLWIIPSLISFGPIISNLIYMALFYSGNFNV